MFSATADLLYEPVYDNLPEVFIVHLCGYFTITP